MRVEILIDPDMARRGARMLDAMIASCPFDTAVRRNYKGDCELLMVYGTGHPMRRVGWLSHIASGRHAIGWDLGYYNRQDQTMRLTVDADHPHRMLQPEAPERWDSAGIELYEAARPAGPVIIVGMSQKANKIHLMGRMHWEMRAAREAKKRHPDREVVYKPKRDTDPSLPGVRRLRVDIKEALHGASLVMCRHSNVAIDACIAGVPVLCEDGAAFALYGKKQSPSRAERLEFLRSLAHWQYTPDEAALAWTFLRKRLCV